MSLSALLTMGALRGHEVAAPAASAAPGPEMALSAASAAGVALPKSPPNGPSSAASTSPINQGYRPQPPPMTMGEKSAIKAWLYHIGEHDPLMIGEVLGQCFSNPEARAYYLNRADQISGYTHDVGRTVGGVIVAVETYGNPDALRAAQEAAEERAAIFEYEGELSRERAEEVAKLAKNFYAHLFGVGKETNCCNAAADRYCANGLRLRALYYGGRS